MHPAICTVLAITSASAPIIAQQGIEHSRVPAITDLSKLNWDVVKFFIAEQARRSICPSRFPNQSPVEHVDSDPAVHVGEKGEFFGYRIILSIIVDKPLPEPYPSPDMPGPALPVKEYLEIVVFPADQSVPPDTKDTIKWLGFESKYHLQTVDMGLGFGFHWFGRLHLWEQDDLRERLGLVGGEDRQALAKAGLAIKDPGGMTANSFACRMNRFKQAPNLTDNVPK